MLRPAGRRAHAPVAGMATALLILILGMVAPGAALARDAGCGRAEAHIAQASSNALGSATVCLVNRERRRHGLRPVRHNARLAKAATRHARDMVRRTYFAHTSLSGANFATRIHRTGYTRGKAWRLGENLGWGGGTSSTPRSIVTAWMGSQSHRANVLGPYKEIGVAIVRGAPVAGNDGAATYTTEFGTLS